MYIVHNFYLTAAYLRIIAEGFLVVDAAACRATSPLPVEGILVPSLLQGEKFGVHLPADAHIRKPPGPVVKVHPRQYIQL
jgi:hypothetical protein